MEEQMESSSEEEHFSQEEIVWAKITGYPWWPALVTDAPPSGSTFRVDFFADNTHAFVSRSKLAKYESLRGEVDLHRHMKKGLRRAIATADQLVRDRLAAPPLEAEPRRPVEARPSSQKQLLQPTSIKTTTTQITTHHRNREQPTAEKRMEEEEEDGEEEGQIMPVVQYSLQRRKKHVSLLLKKYQLDNLLRSDQGEPFRGSTRPRDGRCRRKRQTTCRRERNKIKKMTKIHNNHQSHKHSLLMLLSRRVDHFLRAKTELCKVQRTTIAINLAKQVQGHHPRLENAVQEVTKLLKWVQISPTNTIASYYEGWSSFQSEKEKASSMTNEE